MDAWRGSADGRGARPPTAAAAICGATPTVPSRVIGGRLSPGVFPILRVQPFLGPLLPRVRGGRGPRRRRHPEPRLVAGAVRRPRRRHRDAHAPRRPRLRDRRRGAARLRLPQPRRRGCGRRRSAACRRRTSRQVRVFPAIAPAASRRVDRAGRRREGTAAARGVDAARSSTICSSARAAPMEVRLVRHARRRGVRREAGAGRAGRRRRPAAARRAAPTSPTCCSPTGVARRRELAVRAALGASRAQLLRLMLIEHAAARGGRPRRRPGSSRSSSWMRCRSWRRPGSRASTASPSTDASSPPAAARRRSPSSLAGLLPAWRGSRGQVVGGAEGRRRALGRRNQRPPAHRRCSSSKPRSRWCWSWARCCSPAASIACSSVDAGYDADQRADGAHRACASPAPPMRGARPGRAASTRVLRRVCAPARRPCRRGPGTWRRSATASLSASVRPARAGGEPRRPTPTPTSSRPASPRRSRLRLVAGRAFTAADPVRGGPVLVNETFARRYLGDGRPVGRAAPSRSLLEEKEAPASTIAGVVRDIRAERPALRAARRRSTSSPARTAASGRHRARGSHRRAIRCSSCRRCATSSAPRTAAPPSTPSARWPDACPRRSRRRASSRSSLPCSPALALTLAAIGLYGVLSYTRDAAPPRARHPGRARRQPERSAAAGRAAGPRRDRRRARARHRAVARRGLADALAALRRRADRRAVLRSARPRRCSRSRWRRA